MLLLLLLVVVVVVVSTTAHVMLLLLLPELATTTQVKLHSSLRHCHVARLFEVISRDLAIIIASIMITFIISSAGYVIYGDFIIIITFIIIILSSSQVISDDLVINLVMQYAPNGTVKELLDTRQVSAA